MLNPDHACYPDSGGQLDLPKAIGVIETLSGRLSQLGDEILKLEDALRRNYKTFEALLSSGANGIAITTPDRRIVRVIKGMPGIDHESLAGSLIESFAVHADRPIIVDAYDKLLNSAVGQVAIQVRLIREDGSIVSLAAKLTDMLDDSHVQGIVWNYLALV